jgi:trans-aconitate methyltransferase
MATADTYTDGSYLRQHPTWDVEHSPWKAAQVAKAIARLKIKPKTIADVGCGGGEVLRELQRSFPSDVEFVGYDIAKDAIEIARRIENPKLRFEIGNLGATNVRFDVLLVLDVVEHIEDCFGFLRKIKPRGDVKVFHIPLDMTVHSVLRGLPMAARQKDGHLHYFNRETALATLRDCGYDILDQFFTPKGDVAEGAKARAGAMVRRWAYRLAPRFTVDVLGSYGLMVAAR